MDDLTWNTKLAQRKLQRRREFWLLILLAAVLLGFGLWHFFYACTPEYALRELQSAVRRKDSAAISRYVNLELVSSRAYDDLTRNMFAGDATLSPKTKVLFEKFYLMVKPQFIDGTKTAILDSVKAGEWMPPNGDNILKGRQLGIDYDYFIERFQLRNTEFVKTISVQRDGHSATAAVQVKDTYTQTPFTMELIMEQQEDGHWQVAYIKNYRDYLDAIEPLQNQDIAEYLAATRTIVDTYNQTFQRQQQKFQALTATAQGRLSDSQKSNLHSFLTQEVIPTLNQRQDELDAIAVPAGAQYISQLRSQSTRITIAAWQHFAAGIAEDTQSELETAETLHKEELDIDRRIDDIIKHTAITKNAPSIP